MSKRTNIDERQEEQYQTLMKNAISLLQAAEIKGEFLVNRRTLIRQVLKISQTETVEDLIWAWNEYEQRTRNRTAQSEKYLN